MALNNSQGFGTQAQVNVSPEGVVTSVEVTQPGQGYVAVPKVQILGDGSGATAVCTGLTSTGGVASVDVITGGSGYLPLQYQGTQRATILFTKGYVLNLKYR